VQRRDFAASLDSLARRQGRDLKGSIGWWYRKRYNLPQTDPRYLDATVEEMLTDFYADYYEKLSDDSSHTSFENEDYAADVASLDDDDWETLIDG
jgi:hypothetical protein